MSSPMDMFLCLACQQPLWDPVTVRCGHSFCRRCLQGPSSERCHVCKKRLRIRGPQDLKCNTLLCNLLDKCLDTETKVNRVKRDLQDLISLQEYEEAAKLACKGIVMATVAIYSHHCNSLAISDGHWRIAEVKVCTVAYGADKQAVHTNPEDVSLRILRSQVYLALNQYPEALREAEMICSLQPQNPEGFYRKGMALIHLKEKREALLHFQQCLVLNPQFSAARKEIEQVLGDLACPVHSSLEDLMCEVSCYLKSSSLDSNNLTAHCKAACIQSLSSGASMKLHDDSDEMQCPSRVHSADVMANKLTLSNQERRKQNEVSNPSDKESLNNQMEEENLNYCVQSSPSLQDRISLSDVECSLCIRIFLEPVTTPCGHTFCRECLERTLDHRPYCPLCKQSLREYLRVGCYPVTALLQEIMSAIFPSEMTERKQVHLSEIAELSNLVSNVPIFVCTAAFPGIPCPLHVFEPRYRLMMRRCLETGTKSFGMCLYESGKSFADYGCMLEILHLDYLPDGRSLVETVGRRRFRVVQRGQLDGYHTAEVEYLVDKRLEGEELQEVQSLHDMVYQQLEECFSDHRGSLPRRVFMHHGQPPPKEDNIQASPDGPSWCWWLLSVLPLDPGYQMLILSLTSLKERLLHLKHVLSMFLQSPS